MSNGILSFLYFIYFRYYLRQSPLVASNPLLIKIMIKKKINQQLKNIINLNGQNLVINERNKIVKKL